MEERIPCDYDIHCWIRPLTLTMSINLINSKLHDQFQLKIEHQGASAINTNYSIKHFYQQDNKREKETVITQS